MRVRDRYLEQLDESMQEVLAAIQVTTIGRVISASSCVFLFLSLPFPTPLYLHVSSCVCIRECSLAHLSAFAHQAEETAQALGDSTQLEIRVRFHIIRNARIEKVGKSQSCMVSKLRIICKQTVW